MEKIRNFLDKLADGIVLFDRNGKVEFVNRAVKDVFGLEKESDVRSILKSDDKDIFFKNVIKLLDKGKEYSNFMRFVNKEGNLVFCWLNAFCYENKYVFEIFDLTPVENRTTTISDSSYIKILKYMSEGISHSIRNPIMSAGGMLSRIKAKLQKDNEKDKLIQYIEVVEKSLYRIISIIANLEVVSNSLPVELERVEVGEVVMDLKKNYEDKLEFVIEERDKVFVYINKMHLSFIIDEILKNALDATEGMNNPKVIVRISREGKNAVISIKDNGRGIDEDELPLTTIPFYSTKPSNMGIGLSLAKFLIEGYAGNITLKSEKGEGTEVVIVIPVEKRADIRIKELND
ncbi:sensor histidine kinase [Hippea alviniae]|uniref:sensor histidine kinase n=1 Tax=Hippea alviniae TaxID=1279027 RepID=UPI0003B3DB8B|nr:PAS domain-containing sensor histidine kinase [Hippea alviniae]